MSEGMIYHQAIKLPYRYTAGEANTAFLEGLTEGQLLAGRCPDENIVVAPLQPFCPHCGAKLVDPTAVGPGGVVTTWTRDNQDRLFARIKLDGADTDVFHRVEGDVSTGARIEPRWADDAEREITAIEAFVVV